MKRPRLFLQKNLRMAIQKGHPWVYADALKHLPKHETGTIVQVVDDQGHIGWGMYDPGHPIAIRIWSTDTTQPHLPSLISLRLESAYTRRSEIAESSEAYRVAYGENDDLPGCIIDRYGPTWVIQLDTVAWMPHLDCLMACLRSKQDTWNIQTVLLKLPRRNGGGIQHIWGTEPEIIQCREHHWHMEVDVLRGQKTGWFLDQRDNRMRLFTQASGKRVANLFSYTGGFSLAAALGGATQVATVDIAAPAIEAAKRNFRLNGLEAEDYEFAAEDCFQWLETARRQDRKFDLLVVDPPSFVHNKKHLRKGIRAYEKLFALALQCVEDGGTLAAASCSSHVTKAIFDQIIGMAGELSNTQTKIQSRHRAAKDHPSRKGFPEGDYLKFYLLKVSRN